MKNKKISHQKNLIEIAFKVIVFTVLASYALIMLYMLFWGLITSLKSDTDFSTLMNYLGFPDSEWSYDEIRLNNYKMIFDAFSFKKSVVYYVGTESVTHTTESTMPIMIFNTIVYAVGSALLNTIVCYVTAYMCCKYKFKFSKILYAYVVVVMSTPIVGSDASMITLTRDLGIYDTYFCFILQKMSFGGMYFLVFYAFFESLPDSYTEAAEIDGASQWRVFWNMIIPLGVKMISTVTLINFVAYWNDYQSPLLYTPTLPTLAVGVYELCNGVGHAELKNTPALVAACMILVVPILIIFLALNKKLMGNVTVGGLK